MPQVTKHSSNNLVTVSYPVREAVLDITYPVREAVLDITKAEHDLIVMFSQEKVEMIKFIRGQYNLGLYDAKQVVDTVIASVEVKPEVKPDVQVNLITAGETEIDWSTIKEGTRIFVRDFKTEPWDIREFLYISYGDKAGMPIVCRNSCDPQAIVHWKYAKLLSPM